ncbi:hypothetical protein HYH02_014938 [Chlamydomonas schloesseri]|uniref:HMA domain-containing protein n=1 Tax=Chlamydomonas schloesseri TaxID=2026947 RepID=A0A835VS85_9CHLO|nr:hypothetical protein HYH02_014938 [Chlamydomonas schloesseri]|eukprot:KAG2425875.1 hypothetical protein HYH02_014938 [Chlamydomonas schloesseri]
MFSQDAVRFYNSGGLAPLGGLLHPRRSQPDPKQPAVARSQPYEDMLDTLRQGDQGVAGQGQPGSPGAAGSPPPAPTPAAVASRPAAEQRTCQAGTCRDTSVVDSTNSHVAEQQEGDEYEYDDEGDELETANAEAKAGDAGATGEAAAPPADGDLYLRLRVEGIKCEGCAARLRAAVLALPGVRRCVVDFASKAVLLWGEAGQLGEQGAAVRAAIQHMDLSYRVALEESRRF